MNDERQCYKKAYATIKDKLKRKNVHCSKEITLFHWQL